MFIQDKSIAKALLVSSVAMRENVHLFELYVLAQSVTDQI